MLQIAKLAGTSTVWGQSGASAVSLSLLRTTYLDLSGTEHIMRDNLSLRLQQKDVFLRLALPSSNLHLGNNLIIVY